MPFGLPKIVEDPNQQTIVLNQPGILVEMTDLFDGLEHVLKVSKQVKTVTNDMFKDIRSLVGNQSVSRATLECAILKAFKKYWDAMANNSFLPPYRLLKSPGSLYNDALLENPYLIDAILSLHYVPFDQTEEGNFKSLGVVLEPQTFFTDESYKFKALDLLLKSTRMLLLKNRLHLTWIEGENWRKTYDGLFSVMNVNNKAPYCGRLGSLNFDAPMASDSAVDEEVEDDTGDNFETTEDSQQDLVVKDRTLLRFGPLAIAELDESLSLFHFTSISEISHNMRSSGMDKLQQALKLQVLDKYWYMAAVETHTLVLNDIYSNILVGKAANKPSVKANDKHGLPVQEDQNKTEIDYRNLVSTQLPKKKVLRKLMLAEYAKEYRHNLLQDMSTIDMESKMAEYKVRLIDWYSRNMVEMVSMECEKAEFAKIIQDIRRHHLTVPYGKLIFALSAISKNSDYFNSN